MVKEIDVCVELMLCASWESAYGRTVIRDCTCALNLTLTVVRMPGNPDLPPPPTPLPSPSPKDQNDL